MGRVKRQDYRTVGTEILANTFTLCANPECFGLPKPLQKVHVKCHRCDEDANLFVDGECLCRDHADDLLEREVAIRR